MPYRRRPWFHTRLESPAQPAPRSSAFPESRLERLDQPYRRLDDTRYAYAAPKFGYEVLQIPHQASSSTIRVFGRPSG
ncbi:hypothetical protein [Mesorhizobium sp. WSM3860]|uniref:hypothetical protein n=1 Tax=Mesorhizobium sp. WSM3860 TaxID=2029403 RepID=UPI001FE01276|nr:hypothetical protein [Mesorhizobium sp. WSM3860]